MNKCDQKNKLLVFCWCPYHGNIKDGVSGEIVSRNSGSQTKMNDPIVFFWSDDLFMLLTWKLLVSALEVNIHSGHLYTFVCHFEDSLSYISQESCNFFSVLKGLSLKLFFKFSLAWRNMTALCIEKCTGLGVRRQSLCKCTVQYGSH